MTFVCGTSRYLPTKIVENKDLVQFPEKYRDIIAQKGAFCRVAMSKRGSVRRILVPERSLLLLKNVCIATDSVEAFVLHPLPIGQPATATRIQELCGLKNAYAFDLNSVCSSGVFAMKGGIRTGQ